MAEKSFGLKQINMIGVGTPAIESSSDLIFSTNGSERLRIESDGNIGIGTDNARTELDVRGDIWINRSSADGQPAHFSNPTQLLIQHTSAPNVYLIHGQYKTTIISGERLGAINFASNAETSGNGTPVVGAAIVCEAQQSWTSSFNPGELIFRTNSGSSSAPTDAVGITSEGNIKLYRAGAGIDFSATDDGSGTADSELLDDYEEGEWTPDPFQGANGASATSSGTRNARYIKIGKVVHICCYIQVSKGTNTSQSYDIYGLPYVPDGTDGLHSGLSVSYIDSWSTDVSYVTCTAQPASSRLLVRYIPAVGDGQVASATADDLNSTSNIIIGGTYITSV